MNNTVTSESFNDRQSISDASGVHLDASKSKYQPVRINELLSSYSSSEDEDNDDNNGNKDKEEIENLPETNKASPAKNEMIKPQSVLLSSHKIEASIKSSAPESQITSGFTSDFSKMDIDSIKNSTSSSLLSGYAVNRTPLLVLPLASQQLYTDITSQDKHSHGKVIYKAEQPLPLINKVGRLPQKQMNDGNSKVDTETPMKHQPLAGSMKPIPSQSHRNIFQTPQDKIQSDYHASNVQTPATILSLHNTLMRTPLQPRSLESQPTPGASNIFKQHHIPRQKNEVEKRVRRPLAETTPSHYSHHPVPVVVPPAPPPPPPPPSKQQVRVSTVISPENQNLRQSNVEFKENHHPSKQQQQQHQEQKQKPRNNEPDVEAINEKPNNVVDTFTVKERKYRKLGSLGKGMSGNVYRVQDVKTLELRAIKCVDLKLMEPEASRSCIEEIKLLAKLQAPCIIRMYDYEIRDSVIYTVMEMGDTDLSKFLKEITAEKKCLPLTMILYYWNEMLTAVKHIHDNGVIHSDLKPANFLLVRGRLKLIDFGISSTINADMTSVVKNSTVGTLNYISPEALKGVDDNVDGGNNNVGASPTRENKYKINFKSDVWSLGCILYSMVFGCTPFQHIRNQYGKINAIINPDVKISFKLPESPAARSIPSILIDVIRSCLQRNAKSRPSVDQLLQVQYFKAGNESRGGAPTIIPQSTLRKIKEALQDDEWREFIHNMEKMKYN